MNEFITWDRALKSLNIDPYELKDLIKSGQLPVYAGNEPGAYKKINKGKGFDQVKRLLTSNLKWVKDDCRFLQQDIDNLVENLPQAPLTGLERRELSRLRSEKERLDFNIKAAVCSGLFCQKTGRPVTKDEIRDEIRAKYGDEPTESIFRKIWESLPSELKKSAGRPKK